MGERPTNGGEEATVAVITLLSPDALAAFRREMDLPFPCLADDGGAVHAAYGLARASSGRLLHPATILAYARFIVGGQRLLPPSGEDVHRLGGDFVIDAQGEIRLAHRSRHPADRPAVATLVRALRRCAAR